MTDKEPDIADIIAGELAVSRATAYDLMREALKQTEQPAAWVGLTDEVIDGIYKQHHNQYGECETPNFGYERAIEAKLREKNGGKA